MMIKKEAVGMNKRICTAAAVLALTMCTVHAEAVYNLDEVIVEADMDMSWCCWMGGGWIIRRLIRPADSPAPAGMDRLCLCI